MNWKLPIACIPALTIALFGNPSDVRAAPPAKPTACSLISDGDAKEFAMGKYDRSELSPTLCKIDVMDGEYFVRYMYLTISQWPSDMPKNPDYAKEMVSQTSNNSKQSGGKPLQCSIAGATHFACLDVASPMGSFKPGQRAARVIMGKGNNVVDLTVFHDKRPNLDAAKALAEKVIKKLP